MTYPQDVSLHFTNLCSVTNGKYSVLPLSETVEIAFRVASNKTRAMREFSTTVQYDWTLNAQHHQDRAWTALMNDTTACEEMVEFVKSEAMKPGSNEYYGPVVAGSIGGLRSVET